MGVDVIIETYHGFNFALSLFFESETIETTLSWPDRKVKHQVNDKRDQILIEEYGVPG